MTLEHPLTEHNRRVSRLTEKYRNPPYSLPYSVARQYALKEASKLTKNGQVPADIVYR